MDLEKSLGMRAGNFDFRVPRRNWTTGPASRQSLLAMAMVCGRYDDRVAGNGRQLFRSGLVLSLAAFIAVGCSEQIDKPNNTVAPPKDPATIKVLDAMKALSNVAARRQCMATHQAEAQTLHNDSGAWFEARKLAWADVKAGPNTMDSAVKKTK